MKTITVNPIHDHKRDMIKRPMKIGHAMEELSIPIACPKLKNSTFLSPRDVLHQSNFGAILVSNFSLLDSSVLKAT